MEYRDIFVFNKSLIFQSSTGAGFIYKHFIYEGQKSSLIITAAHVLNMIKYKSITLVDGRIIDIRGYKQIELSDNFKFADVGVIIARDLSDFINVFPHAINYPDQNKDIKVVGYPQSIGGKTQIITDANLLYAKNNKVYTSFNSEYGYSGGPYINSDGEIFAVHHGKFRNSIRKGYLITEYIDYLDSI